MRRYEVPSRRYNFHGYGWRHARDFAYQTPPLFSCTVEKIGESGDEATNEPKGDINSFLQPLVSELLNFWEGVPMSVYGCDGLQKVKCALLYVASDLPAARNVCWFLGHSGRLGCSQCKKEFPGGFGESKDYSGFEWNKWPPRSNHDHRAMVDLI